MNMTTVPSNQLKAMQHEIASLKEQITTAKYNYLGAMADCKRYEETIAQQAEAIEKLRDHIELSLEFCDEEGFCIRDNLESALAIQPSPDIPQARDDRVAAAFEKYKAKTIFPESVCEEDFRAGYLALLNSLELSDWVRDSDNASLYALPEGVEK